MSKPKPAQLTAQAVLNVLAEKHFGGTAYAMLREVRNRTGYGAQDRFADALVVSLWPSRGIWFGGVEVKVSRSDWLSELKKPAKSAAIQKFCSYWWVATPADIIKPGELPETWGHIEVSAAKCKVTKVAPKLECEAPSATFVASVLRSEAGREAVIRQGGVDEGWKRAIEQYGTEAASEALNKQITAEQKVHGLEQERDRAKSELEQLRVRVKTFEEQTGLELNNHFWRQPDNIARVRAARALEQLEPAALERISASLSQAAHALAFAASELPEKEERRAG
jgi:hypothetical protein